MSQAGQHRTLVVKDFKKNGESYTATVRYAKNHNKLCRHNHVPTRKSVIPWVKMFSGV